MSKFTDAVTKHVEDALIGALQPFEGRPLTPQVEAEIIAAVKETLGIGGSVRWLTDAPDRPEGFDQEGIVPALSEREIELLRKGIVQIANGVGFGTKIQVIKALRERTGYGLKAAKDAVEAFVARYEYKLRSA